jgi:hypothetical protein
VVCAGIDPAFMSLLFATIHSFLAVAKTQGWKMYDSQYKSVETIDWPELDPELDENFFWKSQVVCVLMYITVVYLSIETD